MANFIVMPPTVYDSRMNEETIEPVRISKLLAQRGICSRREADRYIEQGLVLLDGEPVRELGSRALPNQDLRLAGDATRAGARQVTVVMHKPVGVVSGQAEDGYEPAITLVRPKHRWEDDRSGTRFQQEHLKGLAVAGRLDIDSTGLLILTQSGVLARQIIGEDSEVEKEYLVRITGKVTDEKIERLCQGLVLDGKPLKRAEVSRLNRDQLKFVLREGKKRQIRRMCEAVDLRVFGLKRVRIGNILLGKLPYGQWRFLSRSESV